MQQGRRSEDGTPQCRNAWSGVKRLGTKEKARRKKCKVDFSIIKKNEVFQESYMKVEVKQLLQAGMVPARTWRVHAAGMAPTEWFKLRSQMAAAARKKNTISLFLFVEAFGLEVQEDLTTMATEYWAEEVRIGKWPEAQEEALDEHTS